MRKRFTLLALFLFTIPFLVAACGTKKLTKIPSQQDMVLESGKPVVQVLHHFQVASTDSDGKIKIEETTGLGTGFVVNVNGLIITNNHIVADAELKKDTVLVQGSEKLEVCLVKNGVRTCKEAQVIDTDKGNDLALLFVVQSFEDSVTFIDDHSLKLTDTVYLWGNIHDWIPPSPMMGRFIRRIEPPYAKQKDFDPITLPLLLLDITFIQGSSGGPTFDSLGRLVGQNKFFTNSDGGRSVCVATPSSTIMKFLKKNKVEYKINE